MFQGCDRMTECRDIPIEELRDLSQCRGSAFQRKPLDHRACRRTPCRVHEAAFDKGNRFIFQATNVQPADRYDALGAEIGVPRVGNTVLPISRWGRARLSDASGIDIFFTKRFPKVSGVSYALRSNAANLPAPAVLLRRSKQLWARGLNTDSAAGRRP